MGLTYPSATVLSTGDIGVWLAGGIPRVYVETPNLKGLLRRVIGKIFNELEIKGWCREIEQEHSAETAARRIEAAKEAEHLVAMPKVA
jgi:hypothetical protein